MGGAAYLIAGHVAPHLVPQGPLPPPARTSFWRRLLGGAPAADARASHVVVSSNGDRHFAILPGPLERDLPRDFKRWLAEQLGAPSRASAVVLEYLEFGGPSISVRGLHRSGEPGPSFWVQLSFSGGAGEAQVSADVAAHWAARWHAARGDQINETFLLPFGFTPTPRDPLLDLDPPFLPAGDLGYLEFTPPETRTRDRLPMFLLDHSLQEAFAGDPRLDGLEARFAGFMAGARCRCQLCEPGLRDLGE